ncbi:MAG: hypothetical protein LAQ30_14925 [Acidobacteriia bacterium]|nr:hypothetical protein [Terriglobia bacterium]
MTSTMKRRILGLALLASCLGAPAARPAWAQAARAVPAAAVEQPDAQHTKNELSALMERYPPTLKGVFANDPTLLGNQSYLASYPALANFLSSHPEVVHNPGFYLDVFDRIPVRQDPNSEAMRMWDDVLQALAVFAGFGMAIGLLVWLIRTIIDARRWSRMAKVQTEVHTKILDRFTANDDLLAYIQSPAGSKFLESTPIRLDAGPRTMGAPLGRILLSVQAGIVLVAAGLGFLVVSARVSPYSAPPLQGLGTVGVALGIGFVISAIISYVISARLGLIERPAPTAERAGVQG